MVIEQRATKAASAFRPIGHGERAWQPFTVVGTNAAHRDVDLDPAADRYVVIDDIDDGFVSLDVSTWPRLDGEGRLFWEDGDDPEHVVLELASLQRWLDARRRRHGTTAPDRPLRIGDTFLLRPVVDTERRGDVLVVLPDALVVRDAWDVTKAARAAAKTAMYGAAGSTVPDEQAAELRLDAPYESPADDPDALDVRQQPVGDQAVPGPPPPPRNVR